MTAYAVLMFYSVPLKLRVCVVCVCGFSVGVWLAQGGYCHKSFLLLDHLAGGDRFLLGGTFSVLFAHPRLVTSVALCLADNEETQENYHQVLRSLGSLTSYSNFQNIHLICFVMSMFLV